MPGITGRDSFWRVPQDDVGGSEVDEGSISLPDSDGCVLFSCNGGNTELLSVESGFGVQCVVFVVGCEFPA